MNQLSLSASNIDTMGTREIAKLTGKQIGHIHRDFKVMCSELNFPLEAMPNTSFLMPNPNLDLGFSYDLDNRSRIANINLNQELTLTLVSGYNAKLRNKIVKRWQELECKASTPQIMPKLDIESARSFVEQVKYFSEMQKQVESFNRVKESLSEVLGFGAAKKEDDLNYDRVKKSLVSKISSTKFKGVYHMKRDNNFIVRFDRDGKSIYLGQFESLDKAIDARVNGEIEYLASL